MGAKKGPQGWTPCTPRAERDVASQGSGTGRQTDGRTDRQEGWAAGKAAADGRGGLQAGCVALRDVIRINALCSPVLPGLLGLLCRQKSPVTREEFPSRHKSVPNIS